MFAPRYFAERYFAGRYFAQAQLGGEGTFADLAGSAQGAATATGGAIATAAPMILHGGGRWFDPLPRLAHRRKYAALSGDAAGRAQTAATLEAARAALIAGLVSPQAAADGSVAASGRVAGSARGGAASFGDAAARIRPRDDAEDLMVLLLAA